MANRKKKIEKKRGTRTCGYGGMRKRRGKGVRGGKGYSGGFKHMKSWLQKYEPDHLGKRGFVPKSYKCVKEVKVINLSSLEDLALKNGKVEINLAEFGFDKVLGSGVITKALTVTAKAFSVHAKEKIEEAGGKAVEENAASE
ncbi:MAG: uL15 family ribosomal protein [Candidatus Aenigmarchaeota archaeon]|nr:uL15 family ribosomal protein [Candidatus Aenigmarchaeota archaeon]